MMLAGGTDATYRKLLVGGGTFLRRLEVWKGGERVDGAGDFGVEVLSGSLSANLENRITRRLNLSLPSSLFPSRRGDLLDPTESELVLWCGWRGGAETPYWWPVFTGPVVTVSATSGEGKMELSALDRAEQIVEDKFTSPVSSGAGRLATTAIKDLISDAQPGAEFGTFDETYVTVPNLTWEADRAQALDNLAAGAGCVWYQLPNGKYSLRIIPWSLASLPAPVVVFTVGKDLISATVARSRSGVYTICQVVGESATGSPPTSGVAYNENPRDVAYYLGPLGRRVLRVQQDTVSTAAQAASLARQRLRQSGSKAAQITTRGLFDPAIELGDTASIVTEHGEFIRALASFTMDLGRAPIMSANWKSPGGEAEE